MICDPCKKPHDAAECIDAVVGREYPYRHCACRHKPYGTALPMSPGADEATPSATPAADDEDTRQ